jgi:23S rRNA pseudouridine1911/1915/1917 synthase
MNEPEILYEDDSIIVVNKPSGLIVHAAHKETSAEDNERSYVGEKTLVEWLLHRYPELHTVGEDSIRPGIVHRIDRDTSGAMVVARTQKSYVRLKRQFQKREFKKTYRAFVYGKIKEERGIINKPLGRTRGSGSQRSVRDPHGTLREAQTVFHTLYTGGEASLLEIFPKTGRTHQIRVHLAAIDHPVICDSLYARRRGPLLGFSRLALHAYSLSFSHPETGKEVIFQAPLPEDFVQAEKELHRG